MHEVHKVHEVPILGRYRWREEVTKYPEVRVLLLLDAPASAFCLVAPRLRSRRSTPEHGLIINYKSLRSDPRLKGLCLCLCLSTSTPSLSAGLLCSVHCIALRVARCFSPVASSCSQPALDPVVRFLIPHSSLITANWQLATVHHRLALAKHRLSTLP